MSQSLRELVETINQKHKEIEELKNIMLSSVFVIGLFTEFGDCPLVRDSMSTFKKRVELYKKLKDI